MLLNHKKIIEYLSYCHPLQYIYNFQKNLGLIDTAVHKIDFLGGFEVFKKALTRVSET
jgi:hypothetical protein